MVAFPKTVGGSKNATLEQINAMSNIQIRTVAIVFFQLQLPYWCRKVQCVGVLLERVTKSAILPVLQDECGIFGLDSGNTLPETGFIIQNWGIRASIARKGPRSAEDRVADAIAEAWGEVQVHVRNSGTQRSTFPTHSASSR